MASTNGPYGSSTSSWHAPSSTRPPPAWTSVASSETRRLLPIPASAVMTTISVWPACASRHCCRSTSRSAPRPTNVASSASRASAGGSEGGPGAGVTAASPPVEWSPVPPVEPACAGRRRRACAAARTRATPPFAARCTAERRSRRSSGARRSAPAPQLPAGSRPGQPSRPPAPPSRRQHVTGQPVESVPGTDAGVVDGAHPARHEAQSPFPPLSCRRRRRDGDDRRRCRSVASRTPVRRSPTCPTPSRSRRATRCTSSVMPSVFRSTRARTGRAARVGRSSAHALTCTARTESSSRHTSADRRGRRATAAPWSAAGSTASPSTPPRSRGCCCLPRPPRPVHDGGRLTSTTFIQRINTTGGLEPPAARVQRIDGGHHRGGRLYG